jgi:hypothetical protein
MISLTTKSDEVATLQRRTLGTDQREEGQRVPTRLKYSAQVKQRAETPFPMNTSQKKTFAILFDNMLCCVNKNSDEDQWFLVLSCDSLAMSCDCLVSPCDCALFHLCLVLSYLVLYLSCLVFVLSCLVFGVVLSVLTTKVNRHTHRGRKGCRHPLYQEKHPPNLRLWFRNDRTQSLRGDP